LPSTTISFSNKTKNRIHEGCGFGFLRFEKGNGLRRQTAYNGQKSLILIKKRFSFLHKERQNPSNTSRIIFPWLLIREAKCVHLLFHKDVNFELPKDFF